MRTEKILKTAAGVWIKAKTTPRRKPKPRLDRMRALLQLRRVPRRNQIRLERGTSPLLKSIHISASQEEKLMI